MYPVSLSRSSWCCVFFLRLRRCSQTGTGLLKDKNETRYYEMREQPPLGPPWQWLTENCQLWVQQREKKACTLTAPWFWLYTTTFRWWLGGFCFLRSSSESKLSLVPWLCGVELVVSTSFTGKPQSRQPTWKQVRLNSRYWIEENFRIAVIQTEFLTEILKRLPLRSFSDFESTCY